MAAALAACRRALLQSGYNSKAVAGLVTDLSAVVPTRCSYSCYSFPLRGQGSYPGRSRQIRYVSQLLNKANGKRAFLVDTLALVRRLEAQGIPSQHAEAITSAITEVLNDSLENVAQSFASQGELQKLVYSRRSQVESLQQTTAIPDCNFLCLGYSKHLINGTLDLIQSFLIEHHFSILQRETEKLKTDIEKLRSELRYEIDKVTAGQRLDLNLERGRTRDELAKQNAETSELTNKLDREIHALKAQLEGAKYDVIKYCIGTLVSITAVGLAVIRILM
ncbi:unnamed protein product [Spirodela intermedia]|uniref:Uncharacterized protein n=1 Tax=Spirodela intermedia TaxID=51605 RepID=A0A7I8K6F6_SPIIN|nr:unnamed protein product [Spirodela intermedia]